MFGFTESQHFFRGLEESTHSIWLLPVSILFKRYTDLMRVVIAEVRSKQSGWRVILPADEREQHDPKCHFIVSALLEVGFPKAHGLGWGSIGLFDPRFTAVDASGRWERRHLMARRGWSIPQSKFLSWLKWHYTKVLWTFPLHLKGLLPWKNSFQHLYAI